MTTYSLSQTIAGGSIDEQAGVITGVSVITEGPALGHGVMIDAQTLQSALDCAQQYTGGLRVKINHGSGADAICGVLRNFRIDGAQLRADLTLLSSHPMRAQLLEMAREIPEAFGLSISFSGQIEEIAGIMFVRCLEIYSCDVVDSPAANPTGLFRRVDTKSEAMTIEELSEQLARAQAAATVLQADLDATRAIAVSHLQRAEQAEVVAQTRKESLSTVTAERDTLAIDLAAARTSIEGLTADLATKEVEFSAKLKEAKEVTSAKINEVLSASGHPPLNIVANSPAAVDPVNLPGLAGVAAIFAAKRAAKEGRA